MSDAENILFGVPQGSVLGPLLFLIYINDIVHSSTQGEFVIFADDTNIFIAAKTKKEAYNVSNHVLRSIYTYMHANQLHINLSKCAHMYFRPNFNYIERMKCARSECYDLTLTLSVNGQKVKQVDKIKFLGVIIDNQLSWNDQIKYVENKLMSTIVLIKRIKKFIPSSHYFKIYHSLFISHLTYGISCWGGICPSKLIKMFNIQKRCVRILFGDKYSFDHPEYYLTCARARTYMDHTSLKDYSLEHTKPIFNKHKLLTLNNLYVLRSLAELIKILKSHTPISMFKFLQFCPRSHHYRLLIPIHNLGISSNNFFIKTIILWNTCIGTLLDPPISSTALQSDNPQVIIPGSNINSDLTISFGTFKTRLKNLLLNSQKLGNHIDWIKSNSLGH